MKLYKTCIYIVLLLFSSYRCFGGINLQKYLQMDEALMGLRKENNKYYLDIPLELLDKDLIVTPTIISTSARTDERKKEKYGYAGDRFPGSVIRLHQNNDVNSIELLLPPTKERILIKQMPIKELWNYLYDVPIYHSYPILDKNDKFITIDITDFLFGKGSIFSLSHFAMDLGITQLKQNLFHGFYGTSTYVEIRLKQMYSVFSNRGTENDELRNYEVAFAISKLDDIPLDHRKKEEGIGYFGLPFQMIDSCIYGVDRCMIAQRWRLQSDENHWDPESNLFKPIKPIVFYIDHRTPNFLVPYFKEAVEVWNRAFKTAGLKDAIIVLTEQDSLISWGDPNISFISYKPSNYRNAYGPRNLDPRSGEILSSSVGVFHGIISLVEEYYFANCFMVDSRCAQEIFPDSLVGELLKLVVAHEVGHSLGLEHNFGGSASRTIKNLRDRSFLEKFGISNSIMDYVRFNFIANPEDSIAQTDLIARIGEYDHSAIKWGYNVCDTLSQMTESILTSSQDKSEIFIAEGAYWDKHAQSNDLSDQTIIASKYGIQKLKFASNALNKYRKDSKTYISRYNTLFNWYQLFIGHVVKCLGSVNIQKDSLNQSTLILSTRKEVEDALDFLNEYLFQEPSWLLKYQQDHLGISNQTQWISLIDMTLSDLIGRYQLMLNYEKNGITGNYSSHQLIQLINVYLFNDWKNSGFPNKVKQMIQMKHIENMCKISKDKNSNCIAQRVHLQSELDHIHRLAKKKLKRSKSIEQTIFFTQIINLINVE